jgi:hypothetical protein
MWESAILGRFLVAGEVYSQGYPTTLGGVLELGPVSDGDHILSLVVYINCACGASSNPELEKDPIVQDGFDGAPLTSARHFQSIP